MSSEDERDPFEFFGELEANDTPRAPAPAPVRPRFKPAFSLPAFAAGLAAPAWLAASLAISIATFGDLTTLDPALLAGLLGVALAPALLLWATAAAAGDAATARKLAADLARMADDPRLPLGGQHAALNDSVAAAMGRLAELEDTAQRSADLVSQTLHASRDHTEALTLAMRREREALIDINAGMRSQTEEVANSIGRQVRLMREAAKIMKSEVTAAEHALQAHLASFAESASAIAERTTAFHEAADQAAGATASLNGIMADMLDGLGEATRLADAAKRSSEQAVLAANDTAGALRETTRTAVVEAKRAAQLMRAETQALQTSAADTLARLQNAAQAARAASEESQAAANRHADLSTRRFSRQAESSRPPAPNTLRSAAEAALARGHRRADDTAAKPQPRTGFKGFGSWGNFVPQTVAEERPRAANEEFDRRGSDAAGRDPDAALKNYALSLVTEAGVNLDDVLLTNDLERIARRSREGASARRAAVVDAAPGAVTRIARYVKRNTKAHMAANEFRARPDLAKSERKGEGSNLVRAYLLIDAALA